MLKIRIGMFADGVNPDYWFEDVFDWKLLETDFSRRLLKDIAKCEVVSDQLVISDVLGPISPDRIGSGVKAVLYMMYGDMEYGLVDMHWCGDNLIPYIREVGEDKDVIISSDRIFRIFSYGDGCQDGFSVELENTGEVFTSEHEFFNRIIEVRGH